MKYTRYLLEMVVSMELESNPALCSAMLTSMLVNFRGKPGHFCALDLMQEHFNWLLQNIVEQKGTEYGDIYICSVVSCNLHHFAHIKAEFGFQSIGLKERSAQHKTPHLKAKIWTLLKEYAKMELHCHCIGQKLGEPEDIDNFD